MDIYVKWNLKATKGVYYPVDWSYEPLQGYDEMKVDEELIKSLCMVNEDNIESIGFIKSMEELKAYREVHDLKSANIEFDGPGYYVKWGLDDVLLTGALSALDVEFDVALTNGNYLKWVTGWYEDILTSLKDLKDCLMDLYGYELDTPGEDEVEEVILSKVPDGLKDKDEKGSCRSIISEDVNNISREDLPSNTIPNILKEAPLHGRVNPAYVI